MNKKAVYSILSVIVAMVVLSVSLVFAIGPRVSADDGEPTIGVLDKAEYFNIDVDENTHTCVLSGLSSEGFNYASQFDELHVVVPDGVTEICGAALRYYNSRYWSSPYSGLIFREKCCGSFWYTIEINYLQDGYYKSSDDIIDLTCKVTSISLPLSLEVIGKWAFVNASFQSIVIPRNVVDVAGYESVYEGPGRNMDYDVFSCCYDLNEIIVQNPDLLTNENLQHCGKILRYEASQNIPEDPIDPEQPENPEQNQPETPVDENDKVNNQNNRGLIVGIAGTAAGILIVAGIVFGIVIAKRRRK